MEWYLVLLTIQRLAIQVLSGQGVPLSEPWIGASPNVQDIRKDSLGPLACATELLHFGHNSTSTASCIWRSSVKHSHHHVHFTISERFFFLSR
mmetsp:Transcript_18750/g.29880  ORF Transcript_18750/g.29880 Transcript_18750/m.29880 type:complete len:93 (-) Transcript_18750:1668-1946(-)